MIFGFGAACTEVMFHGLCVPVASRDSERWRSVMLIPRVHIRLGVRDAGRSRAFYEALFGSHASRQSDVHAVFEIDSPPVVLALELEAEATRASALSSKRGIARGGRRDIDGLGRGPQTGSGRASFVLVVNDPEHVGHTAIALRRAGVRLRLEDQGIEAHDPDGNKWRVRFVPTAKSRAVIAA